MQKPKAKWCTPRLMPSEDEDQVKQFREEHTAFEFEAELKSWP